MHSLCHNINIICIGWSNVFCDISIYLLGNIYLFLGYIQSKNHVRIAIPIVTYSAWFVGGLTPLVPLNPPSLYLPPNK